MFRNNINKIVTNNKSNILRTPIFMSYSKFINKNREDVYKPKNYLYKKRKFIVNNMMSYKEKIKKDNERDKEKNKYLTENEQMLFSLMMGVISYLIFLICQNNINKQY